MHTFFKILCILNLKCKHVLFQALAKAQEASTLERQLIRMQEQANLGDSHNLDLTFAVSVKEYID